jgi:hypothetical protein
MAHRWRCSASLRRSQNFIHRAPPSPRPLAARQVYAKADDLDVDFLSHFKSGFSVRIISEAEREIVFDMVGCDAPVANALRRILLAEVPSMAIDMVYIFKNTGILQDEVLSHRLGQIPLRADPRKLQYQDGVCTAAAAVAAAAPPRRLRCAASTALLLPQFSNFLAAQTRRTRPTTTRSCSS